MSRNQFRLLVVINQLLIVGAVVVQEISDKSLPPELKNYLGIDDSVLNTQITSITPLSDVPYWFGTVLLFVGVIASVGLFFGKGWGRKLFLLNWVRRSCLRWQRTFTLTPAGLLLFRTW